MNNRLPLYLVHKDTPEVWMVFPFSFQGEKSKLSFSLSHPPGALIIACEVPLFSRAFTLSRIERPLRLSLNLSLYRLFKTTEQNGVGQQRQRLHHSILPHPAQKQVPGNLHPALGTVSPGFTQVSANPQEPGLPALSLD